MHEGSWPDELQEHVAPLQEPPGLLHHPWKETQRQLRRALHAYYGTTDQLARDVCDRYICRMFDPVGAEYTYSGSPNSDLDAPCTLPDMRAALAKLLRGMAPGRDRITVSLLANRFDRLFCRCSPSLTRYRSRQNGSLRCSH